MSSKQDKVMIPLIGALSVVVPLLVALLIMVKPAADTGMARSLAFLPALNAGINSTVSILLILGYVFIRRKDIYLHRTTMLAAFALSAIFLISYVIYHYAVGSVKFGGEGGVKLFYLLILFSHIVLSVVIVPLALLSIYRSWSGDYEKHKKLVRWTWPIWLYVSLTGVVVYLMAHVFNPGTA